MKLSRYAFFAVALVVATCGSALPGLTSRENRPLPHSLPPTVSYVHPLPPEPLPDVFSTFSEVAPPPDEEKFANIPEGFVYWKTVTARVTAYDPSYRCCGRHADGKTAIMDNAWVLDGVAVDPRAIPYRTLALVPGVGLREADDTGTAMKHSWSREGVFHIDVRLKYFYQARNWGVKVLEVPLFRKIK